MANIQMSNYLEHLKIERMSFKLENKELRRYVKTIQDVYLYRSFLINVNWDFENFDYLVSIVDKAIQKQIRHRKKPCLMIVKRIIKLHFKKTQLPKKTLKKLFNIYKVYIYSNDEEILWAISVFLKDQKLSNEHLKWLIENWQKSKFILNRLLKYPQKNRLIELWAFNTFKEGTLKERTYELIGAFLHTKEIASLIEVDRCELAWGIYYSKYDEKWKIEALKSIICEDNYTQIEKISLKLASLELLSELINHVQKACESESRKKLG